MSKSGFTVFFEEPFWVGVYEREENGLLRVSKVIFGAQPRDYEVYQFLLDNWHKLKFGPATPADVEHIPARNPKRVQRAIARQLRQAGAGTKAQQAIQLGRLEGKQARRDMSRRRKEEEQARQFSLRCQRKKEKHKGH